MYDKNVYLQKRVCESHTYKVKSVSRRKYWHLYMHIYKYFFFSDQIKFILFLSYIEMNEYFINENFHHKTFSK